MYSCHLLEIMSGCSTHSPFAEKRGSLHCMIASLLLPRRVKTMKGHPENNLSFNILRILNYLCEVRRNYIQQLMAWFSQKMYIQHEAFCWNLNTVSKRIWQPLLWKTQVDFGIGSASISVQAA